MPPQIFDPNRLILEGGWGNKPMQLDLGNADSPLYPDIRETNLGRAMSNQDIFAPAIGVNEQARSELPDINGSAFDPSYEAQNRYSQMIDQYPIRDKPSFARKLVASLAGLAGGIGAADEVLMSPHKQNVADWKLRTDEAGQAAVGESRINRDAASRDIQAKRAEIAQQQADTAALKNHHEYETTLAKMQQAIAESDAKLKLAYEKMNMDMANKDNILAFRQAQMDSNNARHAAEMAMKDKQLSDLNIRAGITAAQAAENERGRNKRFNEGQLPEYSEDELIFNDKGEAIGRRRKSGKIRPGELPSGSQTTGAGNKVRMTSADGKQEYEVDASKVAEAESKYKLKRK